MQMYLLQARLGVSIESIRPVTLWKCEVWQTTLRIRGRGYYYVHAVAINMAADLGDGLCIESNRIEPNESLPYSEVREDRYWRILPDKRELQAAAAAS